MRGGRPAPLRMSARKLRAGGAALRHVRCASPALRALAMSAAGKRRRKAHGRIGAQARLTPGSDSRGLWCVGRRDIRASHVG